ncbi:MAG: HAD family hydrolase, partial [Dolichospermum sp.]
PVLIKALIAGFSDDQILQSWTTITSEILAANNLEIKAVSTQLDNLRDEWIEKDLDGWLSLHRFYPGVIERLKITLETEIQLYIVTTKEGRFVKQLLQQEGVNL